MIVLDTNVLSELMRLQPDTVVLRWVDAQPSQDLSVTTITVGEIWHGIALFSGSKLKSSFRCSGGMGLC